MTAQIDIELFKKKYSKEWLNELLLDYTELTKSCRTANQTFFLIGEKGMGNYVNRNQSGEYKIVNEYLNCLLYAPNIAVIDYVLKNIKDFKKIKCIDNGCGFGLLSVFLSKIGVECINYDTGKQLGGSSFFSCISNSEIATKFYKKYKVKKPVNNIEQCNDIQAVISCGIWVDSITLEENPNLKYCMLDTAIFTPGTASHKHGYESTEKSLSLNSKFKNKTEYKDKLFVYEVI